MTCFLKCNPCFLKQLMWLGFHNINSFCLFCYLLYFLGWFLFQGSIIWLFHVLPFTLHMVLVSLKTWNMLINPKLILQPGFILSSQISTPQLYLLSMDVYWASILYNISKSEFIIYSPQLVLLSFTKGQS